MLYDLARPFANQFILFNLLRYITFRSGAACLTALVVSFILGPPLIRWLKSLQRQGQPIRIDGPERHLIEKKGTPTMGGVLILFALSSRPCSGSICATAMSGRCCSSPWLRRAGLCRRLPEVVATQPQGRLGTHEADRADADRAAAADLDRVADARPARHRR